MLSPQIQSAREIFATEVSVIAIAGMPAKGDLFASSIILHRDDGALQFTSFRFDDKEGWPCGLGTLSYFL